MKTPLPFDVRRSLTTPGGRSFDYFSLPALKSCGFDRIDRLPVSIRIVLESLLRNFDGRQITEAHIRDLANWQPNAPRVTEIPFKIARILLQDFTGVPLLADLAAMRSTAADLGVDPKKIEPELRVDLVVDHSVAIDHYGRPDALQKNMAIEFARNDERYRFMKWGQQAFSNVKVTEPGVGICHQVNLEHLARGPLVKEGVAYFDSLVGTDSHTTMIDCLGVVAWGVGGIEAEAAMLGQPLYFLTPDVVGVELTGKLRPGITATDLVLRVTELLRKTKVVGKFVEFFGEGAASLSLPDRATIANMAPEYGATMGFFTVDDKTIDYFAKTGRSPEEIDRCAAYFAAQGLYGIPKAGQIDYSETVALDLDTIRPAVAGPRRPQDRIEIGCLKASFEELLTAPVSEGGFGQGGDKHRRRSATGVTAACGCASPNRAAEGPNAGAVWEAEGGDSAPADHANAASGTPSEAMNHGDIAIAAITSCTNTSNPSLLIAAGLLAKKAAERGLTVNPRVKTSFAPGSRVGPAYLEAAGLLDPLCRLGFDVAAFGCTTCIGNSGPLDPAIEAEIADKGIVAAAVLSGNRNFEARIHSAIRANFLASPPLVIAYAIAGTVDIDLTTEPIGFDGNKKPVMLEEVWPTDAEVAALLPKATDPALFSAAYESPQQGQDAPISLAGGKIVIDSLWNRIDSPMGDTYQWAKSTYIARPPFFDGMTMSPSPVEPVTGAKILAIFGDSVTTDHISPAGAIKPTSPAGLWLQEQGVAVADFNSYGSRRGNHEVMMRGTFANTRIKNLMIPPSPEGNRVEGGFTLMQPGGQQMAIYDAAMAYQAAGTPTVIFAGEEYGTGSSRDWAAKGTALLGVRAVIAKSFERIHRANLVGMGVIPLQFIGDDSAQSLGLTGAETIDLIGVEGKLTAQQNLTMRIVRADGSIKEVALKLRIDTPIEVDYITAGGILPFVLRQLLA